MKALVTGANGQVGRAVIGHAPDDWSILAMTRADLDLIDLPAVERAIYTERPDLVINCGAYTQVDQAELEPEIAMRVNGIAPGTIARALRQSGGRLIQLSTDYVFDGLSQNPYRPDDTPNPLSVYGKSKATGELEAGGDAIILRTSGVFAAEGRNFVSTMLRLLGERQEVSVVHDQISAPTWASGLARTIWHLAKCDRAGIYHHRDAGQASWYDLTCAIAEEAAGLDILPDPAEIEPITSKEYGARALRPAFSVLDDSDTRKLTGDIARHWRENLRYMLKEEISLG